jgi:FecR protein
MCIVSGFLLAQSLGLGVVTMAFRTLFRFSFILVIATVFVGTHPIYTGASNARIIRLSLVQGDVRILHGSKGDPLANDKAPWDRAELNLPIREHDVIATDNGRAEVEFENGAMAFIAENSVLEFFDLSLDNGALNTRLILRQGTASFYVNPSNADYFSVTGGDFTAEAGSRSNFRMGNFDDGSTISVSKGRVAVVHKGDNTVLARGQSLTMRAGDDKSVSVGRTPDSDDFDRWVSGREDSVVTATNATAQYTNSSSYVSGFADLYTYGGFYPISGYGYGWQPYGVGAGWSPFSYGNWLFDSGFGWSFIGSEPWGWLPYHYGGWIFQPGVGYLWTPNGLGQGGLPPVKYHPVTAAFVRSTDALGIVPSHPQDGHSKTPINLAQGVLPLTTQGGAKETSLAEGSNWSVVKQVPSGALVSHTTAASAPVRSSHSLDSSAAARSIGQTAGSTIAYDAKEHRFVNSASSSSRISEATSTRNAEPSAAASSRTDASAREVHASTSRTASSRVASPPSAPRGGGSFGDYASARGSSGPMATSSVRSSASVASTSRGGSSARSH